MEQIKQLLLNETSKMDSDKMHCTPLVIRYRIPDNKWGALLCRKV